MCVSIYLCWNVQAMVHAWRLEEDLLESVLSFYHIGVRDFTQGASGIELMLSCLMAIEFIH